ncbi:ABC transporter ATP-binding protein [Pantoea sp. EA-12]|uniref:ABC transporter ATP-binding protein n=1 Tax=Pantoea sp. EA-12 TaxID=3043303 RepID=UPI0024B5EF67|nr:ABC transporter ATP-binding protein [Pantoea sp. EA-12]MDI9219889.1 ABC transporter ATP-binding protein [Pantoea sp. EA-12]
MSIRLEVKNTGKAYKVYRSKISKLLTVLFGSKNSKNFFLKWIVRNINFTIKHGEAVGIIGINGAGKSTLLKIITGTIKPTEGSIVRNGRIVALLELGLGFHPEFTGRQNVYMSGQLLGLSVNEIDKLFDEIVNFSEIGDYINQPVRVYSSGMQVRLAFSVATAVRPDLLIIDEALSVGDAYFQHKSFERIKKFKQLGTSLLLVSHDKQAIQSICDRAILISAGNMELDGEPEEVLNYYNAMLSDRGIDVGHLKKRINDNKKQTTSGDGKVSLINISIINLDGNVIELVKVGERVKLIIEIKVNEDLNDLVLGYLIKDKYGREIFGTNSYFLKQQQCDLKCDEVKVFEFTFDANVGEGNYSVSVAAHRGHTHVAGNYLWKDVAIVFNVINTNKSSFIGSSWIEPILEIKNK